MVTAAPDQPSTTTAAPETPAAATAEIPASTGTAYPPIAPQQATTPLSAVAPQPSSPGAAPGAMSAGSPGAQPGAMSAGSAGDDFRGERLPPARRPEYPHQRPGEFRPDPRPAGEPAPPTNIYRARRPAFAAALIIPAVLVGLLLVRALAIAAFGPTFSTSGVIASSLALTSLPMLVSGVYGLLTGAAYGAEHVGFKVWAKPPLAYLVVGIAFVIAAGLAIG